MRPCVAVFTPSAIQPVRPHGLGAASIGCSRSTRQVLCQVATVKEVKKKSGFSYEPPAFYPEMPPRLEVELAMYDAETMPHVDVAIAGAGPAGLATAARISQQGFSVAIVDPAPLAHWPNNYGVWSDEFEAMGLEDCFEIEWSKANVWLGEGKERCVFELSFTPVIAFCDLNLKRTLATNFDGLS